VGVELFIYIHCVCLCRSICKAYSLGLVYFTGETLSDFFQKFYSTNGSDSLGVRGVTSLGPCQSTDCLYFSELF